MSKTSIYEVLKSELTTCISAEPRVNPANEQFFFEFQNGYGASIVRGPFTYGGPDGFWEMAVLKKDSNDFESMDNFVITYDTPITEDVLGWLDETEVLERLKEIEAL